MSREDLVAVGTRLFAIYVALNVLMGAARAAPAVFEGGWTSYSIFFVLLWVLALMVCGLLWVFPLTVARKFLPVMREPRSEESVDAKLALSLGLTLIGVWILGYAIVDSIYWVTLAIHVRQIGPLNTVFTDEQLANMVSTASEFIVGAWLVFGNAGIRRLIYRFRYGAAVPAEAQSPAARREGDS